MNYLGTAVQQGFNAVEILKQLSKVDKQFGKKVRQALEQGFSPDEIVSNMNSQSFGARAATPRGFTTKENVERNLASARSPLSSAASSVGKGLALASTGLGLAAAARPVIGTAANLVGSYLSNQVNQPPSSNLAAAASQPAAAPAQTPAAPIGGKGVGGFLKTLIPSIATYFGFKNKPLINAVANIIEKTGQDVATVYNQLAEKYDISTPEKAAEAATSLFKRLQGEAEAPTTVEKLKEESKKAKEVFKRFKPVSDSQKTSAPAESAVIRRAEYDPKSKKLVVVFNKGSVYEYENVPEEVYRDLLKGSAPAKTEGKNEYGAWWVGKDPSIGATFNKLIKQGGYSYQKVAQGAAFNPEEITPEEEEALSAENLRSLTRKTKAAAGEERFVGKQKIPLTREQLRQRRILLEKSLQDIKQKPQAERTSEFLDTINERLKTLKQMDKLVATKKSKVLTEEVIRSEKAEGKRLIKKMLVLLPASIVKVLKQKIDTTSEEDMLKMIKEFLSKK
jgi:hypothetical protein